LFHITGPAQGSSGYIPHQAIIYTLSEVNGRARPSAGGTGKKEEGRERGRGKSLRREGRGKLWSETSNLVQSAERFLRLSYLEICVDSRYFI
jgi:hypothetical protein